MSEFGGKSIVVTGGSLGMGLACARRFARGGHHDTRATQRPPGTGAHQTGGEFVSSQNTPRRATAAANSVKSKPASPRCAPSARNTFQPGRASPGNFAPAAAC